MDEYCNDKNINALNFIKIDVEGAEKYVFEGAEQLLKDKKNYCILFEVNQQKDKFDTDDKHLMNLLEKAGYSLYDYDYKTNSVMPLEKLPQNTHINILAVSDIEKVKKRINS